MDEKTLGQVAYETRMKKFVTSSTWDNVSPEMQRVWEETALTVVEAHQNRRIERLMRKVYEAGGEAEYVSAQYVTGKDGTWQRKTGNAERRTNIAQ